VLVRCRKEADEILAEAVERDLDGRVSSPHNDRKKNGGENAAADQEAR